MKVTIKGIVNENIDPEEKYVNKLTSILKPPYFHNLKLTETPEYLWNRILSKIFNQEVTLIDNKIYDSNNNRIYYENSNGDWSKREYDSNNNEIYYEDSDGDWRKSEYDSNGNVIYRENSDGYWIKREFDLNNNEIYRENSDGEIIDRRPINENIDPEEKYINKLSSIIKRPYFYNLRSTSTPESLWGRIFSKIFNQEVTLIDNKIYNSNGNVIYYENSNGDWSKREYDSNNNEIYYENSNGIIIDIRIINENIDPEEKYVNKLSGILKPPYFHNLKLTETPEYLWNRILSKIFNQLVRRSDNSINNSNGIEIYREVSNGFWEKREYDSNGNVIYFENSNGYWKKYEYDSNGNLIYYENSNGFWEKYEYDSNGNLIYREDSDGEIIDRRPINENIDPEEKYVNKLSSIIKRPYFYNLRSTSTPESLWGRIFSKIFNQEVEVSGDHIYNSNGNLIYYEDSNGDWRKSEYDSNNNEIYYEDSDGDWRKSEYDSNGNLIYRENSDGYWIKREFDLNNNEIYYENSDGVIIDRRPINENIDPEEKYINKLSSIIKRPYFYNLRSTSTPEYLWNRIFSKIFNQEVEVSGDHIYNSNGNVIYLEYSDGFWIKYEYDSNNNEIYSENSDGFWIKYEYNSNGRLIYTENSDGFWIKYEYDSNNNEIYRENSNGYWKKYEYDSNGRLIYYENSDGEIRDNRSINTINENIDPEEKYINKLSSIIKRPYFYNLIQTDTPKNLWSRILSNKLKEGIHFNGEGYKYGYEYTLNVKSNKDGHIIYDEISHRLVNNLPFWSQTKDIQPQNSDMTYICYVNSRGNKEVSAYSTSKKEKYYSNQPHGLPFEDLPEEIKNDEIFNLNY